MNARTYMQWILRGVSDNGRGLVDLLPTPDAGAVYEYHRFGLTAAPAACS